MNIFNYKNKTCCRYVKKKTPHLKLQLDVRKITYEKEKKN